MSDEHLPAHRRRPSWLTLLVPACVLALATAAAYWPALQGPLVFDDASVLQRPDSTLGRLLASPAALLQSHRPLTDLSYLVGHWLHGPSPLGHHALSLAMHVLAGLTLMDLLRRTLAAPTLQSRWGDLATPLAVVIAGLWMLHPLQTQAVAYLAQRSEVLATWMIFLSLDALAMSAGGGRAGRAMLGVSVLACIGAMLSKQIGYVTPLLLILYDRAFWAGGLLPALRGRPVYHTLIALTLTLPWALGLGDFLFPAQDGSSQSPVSAGLGLRDSSPWLYALSQPSVLAHGLGQIIWPHPLVLDYRLGLMEPATLTGWPAGLSLATTLALIVTLGVLALWATWRRPAVGFAGAAFFLVLAPTSSFLPLADLVMEHRLYGPSSAVITLIVLAMVCLAQKLCPDGRPSRRAMLALTLLACIALTALAGLTARRSADYADPAKLWASTLRHRPANTRAMLALGKLLEPTQPGQALALYRQAARLEPHNYEPMLNLGSFLLMQGHVDDAQRWYETSHRLSGDQATYLLNRGMLAEARNDPAQAVHWLTQAVALRPDHPEWLANLGMATDQLATHRLAQGDAAAALALRHEAVGVLGRAVAMSPRSDAARRNLAIAQAHLGVQHMQAGRFTPARQTLEQSLDTQPQAATLRLLAWLLATWPDLPSADRHEALRVAELAWQRRAAHEPAFLYQDTLAAAQAALGQYEQAVAMQQQAIASSRDLAVAPALRQAMADRLKAYEARRPHVQATPQAQADRPGDGDAAQGGPEPSMD